MGAMRERPIRLAARPNQPSLATAVAKTLNVLSESLPHAG